MKLTKEEFLSLKERIKSPLFKSMAAVIINPQIIQEEITLPVDVNDVYSPSYGQTLAYKGQKPEGTQEARIVLMLDTEKVTQMLRDLFDKL